MNIILTGPMGAGKTTLGMEVARLLNREFIDTDELIELRTGHSISNFFTSEGENKFRQIEKQIIKELMASDNLVIATGGGAVLSNENMRHLRLNGIIVNLMASVESISNRLANAADRPLLDTPENLKKYLVDRAPYYSNADFRIVTDGSSVSEVAAEVIGITRKRFVRLCACISGESAIEDILTASRSGASMIELRLDLIPDLDVESLVRASAVPVIATDRDDKDRLRRAIIAGCEYADIEADAPEKEEIIKLARLHGCKVIVSAHYFDGVPEKIPEIGNGDLLKIAALVSSEDDLIKIMKLHGRNDNTIIVAMGELGVPQRVLGPTLGSYLTYCYVGIETAPGQLELGEMVAQYKEMGLR